MVGQNCRSRISAAGPVVMAAANPAAVRRPETAGFHAVTSVARGNVDESVAAARAALAGRRYEVPDLVLVTDRDGTYRGAVTAGTLAGADPGTRLGEAMNVDWPAVPAGLDQEKAVATAVAARVATLPVLDHDSRPIG